MKIVGRRGASIAPSATLELAARAKQLREEGKAVLNLTVGEPDLATPEPVVAAAHEALRQGHFQYTPTPGVMPLRRAVAESYSRRLRLPVQPNQIVVSNGAKQALYNALATATDPGDRVGVLLPYWISYAAQVAALGGELVTIDCPKSSGFRPRLDQLERELDRGLRLLIVNSPCNPTGAAFGSEDWAPILALLERYDTLLLSDEIYEDIVYRPEGHVSPLHVSPELASRCCVVSGLSKAYAMTGWRVGYSIAPPEWSAAMAALQGHVTSNINAVTQQASIVALNNPSLIDPLRDVFAERREMVCARAAELAGVSLHVPEGTFYVYLDVSERLGSGEHAVAEDVNAFAAWLLDEHLIAVIPGSVFGDSDHVRLSFAAASDQLEEAFQRLTLALGKRAVAN